MKKNTLLALLILGGILLLANHASAVNPKPRPLPILPPTTPGGSPVVSAS